MAQRAPEPSLMAFRRGTPDDADALGRLVARIFDDQFGEAWTAAQLHGTLIQVGSWAELGIVNGKLAGFSLLRFVVDEAELLLVGIDPALQRRGEGRHFVTRAMEEARRRGCRRLTLEVRAGNVAARGLYASSGFTQIGERADYYRGKDGSRHDAITMQYQFSRK